MTLIELEKKRVKPYSTTAHEKLDIFFRFTLLGQNKGKQTKYEVIAIPNYVGKENFQITKTQRESYIR